MSDTAVVDRETTDLTALATTANREHRAANEAARSALEHARAAGKALIKAKWSVPHGEWTAWLEANFDATPQTARNYMRIARRWTKIENENAFSIRDALAALARGKDDDDPDPDPDDDEGRGLPPLPPERVEYFRIRDRVDREARKFLDALRELTTYWVRPDATEYICQSDVWRVGGILDTVERMTVEALLCDWPFDMDDLPRTWTFDKEKYAWRPYYWSEDTGEDRAQGTDAGN